MSEPLYLYLEEILCVLKTIQEKKGKFSVLSKNELVSDLIVKTKGLFLKMIDVRFKKKLRVNSATVKKVLEEPNERSENKLTLENFILLNEQIANSTGVLSTSKKEFLLKKIYAETDPQYHTFLNDYYESGAFKMGFNERLCLSCISKMYPQFLKEIKDLNSKFKPFWLYELYLNCLFEKFSSDSSLFYKPMLATTYDIKKFKPNEYYGEIKYDGFRVLVRKEGQNLTYWSRAGHEFDTPNFLHALTPVTDMLKNLKDDFILDGEVWLQNNNASDCFRILSPLVKTKALDLNYKQKYFKMIRYTFFDILENNKKLTSDLSYFERRKILENLNIKSSYISESILLTDLKIQNQFFKKVLDSNYEGIILKHKDSKYQCNKRSVWWMKKKPCMESLDVKVLNFKKGTGKYAHWYASFTIGLEENNEVIVLGNIGSGFNEKDLQDINKLIASKKTIILEVTADSVTRSVKYPGGWALRFPRLVNIRWDKTESDPINKFKTIYKL